MSDVFISYSRKDNQDGFITRLMEGLEADQIDTWLDKTDIPPAVDFLKEIYPAIEAADNFVFVLSPDSVTSHYCLKELAHAVQHNKRLIPVMRRRTPSDLVASDIRPLNWISFTLDDDFDSALQLLTTAIRTADQTYVHAHTRLLQRALDWQARDQNNSFLLRGIDLRQAEEWQAQSATKAPKPTELQTQYILESRKGETRRQRSLLGGVSVALVVALSLAVLSFMLFQQSESNLSLAQVRGTEVGQQAATATNALGLSEQRGTQAAEQAIIAQTQAAIAEANEATAVYQGGVSQSLALAAQSQLEIEGVYPERAVLLALEALQDFPYTLQAERALGLALQNHRTELIMDADAGAVYSVDWQPMVNGASTRVVSAHEDGTARVWNTLTGEDAFTLSGHGGPISEVEWSPDGQRIATAAADGARVWDAQTGTELLVLPITVFTHSVAWSPDSERIITSSVFRTVKIWDADSGEELLTLSGQAGEVYAMNWSPDGTRIATAGDGAIVNVWDAETGEALYSLSGHKDRLNAIAWSPDGRRLATASGDNTIKTWDTNNRTELSTFVGHNTAVYDVAWQPLNPLLLASASTDGSVKLWNAETGEELNTLARHSSFVHNLDWSPDGQHIVTASGDSTVRMWRAQQGSEINSLVAHTDIARHIEWSPNGECFLTTGDDGLAQVWDAVTNTLLLTFSGHASSVNSGSWSPDGTQIVTASSDGTARVWNADSGKELLLLQLQPDSVIGAVWSPDGERIATGTIIVNLATGTLGGAVTVWDAVSGTPLVSLPTFPESVGDLAWSPDSTRLAVAIGDNTAAVWDAATGKQLQLLNGHTNRLYAIAWSADGTRLATGSQDTTIRIWDTTRGDELYTLFGHGSIVWDLTWSPDGTRILSAGDTTARIWNSETGEELNTFDSGSLSAFSVDWSPNGVYMLVSYADGSVRLWPGAQNHDDLIVYAQDCCVVRELTNEERAQFGLVPQ